MKSSMTAILLCALFAYAVGASVRRTPPPGAASVVAAVARARLQTLSRASHTHTGPRPFKGYYWGRLSGLGVKARYNGGFAGETRPKGAVGSVHGDARGRVRAAGFHGRLRLQFGGRFKINARKGVLRYKDQFIAEFRGRFNGKRARAVVKGRSKIVMRDASFILTEKAQIRMLVAGRPVRMRYRAFFDGITLSAQLRGKWAGKNFTAKYEVSIENPGGFLQSDGKYVTFYNGKKLRGSLNSMDAIYPAE